jgi:excisionase family DNA binding protein
VALLGETGKLAASDRRGPATRVAGEPGSRLLEANEVARYLGMRTDWVYREVRAGRLPHIRLGRAVRFRRESIEAWLESRERAASNGRRR